MTVNVIPKPLKVTCLEGCLKTSEKINILAVCPAEISSEIKFLERFLNLSEIDYCIRTDTSASNEFESEGYLLRVSCDEIIIRAGDAAGIFYAVQTLRQLMTAEECRCCEIYDRPRFPWRGSLLDTGRHFFDKEFVKKYIDILAFHKFNRFHFHLTEDQGWRIEIKKYPQLTEQGAYRRENGSVYGGYFTRQDIKEIVAYAKERHIMVIPEIDMPGHCYSALSVFPELSCSGGPFVQEARWGVYKDVYCAGNEKVYSFLQDVLDEIIDLFDSPYIHIGGDECPKDQWSQCPRCQDMIKRNGLAGVNKLQSYFIRRIQKYLASKNKTIIGWDEIMTGGLPDNAVVQIWHGDGIDKSVECAKSGNKMIMSPQFHCYLNHPYEILPLNMFYDYEPIANVLEPGVKEKLEENVLGIEACVWTEYIPNESEFNFKVFPRLFGLAEVAWSQGSNKDYQNYQLRLKKHIDVFRKLFDIDCDMHKRFEYHLKRLRELYDV